MPGYKLQRELGRGASSRVYLALQHAFGRSVAIKVVTSDTRNPALRERFLHDGNIAKGLDHPNIVRVLEVGAGQDLLYRVMEYVRGGDLNRNLATGLHLQNLLMAVKEVAAALDYAHGRGVVHGDVRPENILLDEQGAALLSDFGAAPRGAAGASPFASPEQLAGDPIDGRSDVYSLGVVFYRMLTGRMPFDDAAGQGRVVRLRELPLPLQFAAFHEVMRRFLAKSPDDRFQSGAEIAAMLDSVRFDDALPDAVVKTEVVTNTEIDAAENARTRQSVDDAAAVSPRRRPLFLAVVLAGVLVAGAGVWYSAAQGGWTRSLAFLGLVEHPDTIRAWAEAEALRLDSNQSLSAVVSAYRQVQAFDAAHPGAAAAISAAATRWQTEIEAALDGGDIGLADAKLNELAAVFPAYPMLTTLYDRRDDRRQAEELLTDASRLLAREGLGRPNEADAAIAWYKEALRLDPGNVKALAGLDDIARYYGALAAEEDAAGDISAAMASFGRAVAANEDFEGVDAVRATISDAEAVQAEIEANLQEAANLRQAGRLIEPPGENPLEIYRRVLATDPDNSIAQQGLSEISATVLGQFETRLQQGLLGEANLFKDRAGAAGVGDDLVAEMATRYDEELARIATVEGLIARAEELYAEGYITGPDPEDNAVARLREALRLDPDNADGSQLLILATTRLAAVAQDAYDAGMAADGLSYLDLALTVTPDIGRWQERRERWQAEIEKADGP